MINWKDILEKEFEKDYFKKIEEKIEEDTEKGLKIFPEKSDIFNAFKLTKFEDLKIVILWQDPYHWEWQAHWLAFSVKYWVKQPPSLKNIFKELNSSLNIKITKNGDLSSWARQWVFLLNTSLTVLEWKANSHSKIWWEIFTDNIIKEISDKKENVVFLLWWANAINKKKIIDTKKHFIIETSHPSPLSSYRGFLWSNCFKEANEILIKNKKSPIDWEIKDSLHLIDYL